MTSSLLLTCQAVKQEVRAMNMQRYRAACASVTLLASKLVMLELAGFTATCAVTLKHATHIVSA